MKKLIKTGDDCPLKPSSDKTGFSLPVSPQTAVLLAVLFLCMIGSILTFSSSFITGIVISSVLITISVLVTISRKRRGIAPKKAQTAADIIVIVLLTVFYFSVPPIIMSSSALWQYPFQKRYADMYHNIREPEFFPDIKSAVTGDYRFDYLPGMLQGSGHYTVRFTTSSEHIQEYEQLFSSQARHIYKYAAQSDYFSAEEERPDGRGTVDVFLDSAFFEGHEVTIYVLDTNYNWNHPHTSAVIIDSTTGKVQFSQYG